MNKKESAKRTCEHCGKDISARPTDARYCGLICRRRAARKRRKAFVGIGYYGADPFAGEPLTADDY